MFSTFVKGALVLAALTLFLQLLTGFFPVEFAAFPLDDVAAVLNGLSGVIQLGINFTTPIIQWSFVGTLLTISIAMIFFGLSWKVGIFVWKIVRHV